jgi:hypothetical protein
MRMKRATGAPYAEEEDEPDSVVISGLQEIDLLVGNDVDDAMLLSQASRPRAGSEVFERLRFSDSRKRLAHHRLYDLQNAQCDLTILRYPEAKIFAELWLEDSLTIFLLHDDSA